MAPSPRINAHENSHHPSDDSSYRTSADTLLAERLRARIRREGPLSFHEWMQAALYDPVGGYYCRSDRVRWGREGDYRTAPEISRLFAATFARYFNKLFNELHTPSSWTVLEAGSGAGEFARGVLSSLRSRYPDVYAATNYVIDEVSADARAQTAERLMEFGERVTFQSLTEITSPARDGIVFSNELIDAFPVHRVIVRDGKLCELYVDLDGRGNFTWAVGEINKRVAEYCEHARLTLAEGQIAEINLYAEDFISRAAALVTRGFVITVDYGAERNELISASHRFDGTLRAFHRHQLVNDALSRPGEQDLTTTIDWTQIKESSHRAGLKTIRQERLDQFLLNEGLLEELEALAHELTTDADVLRLRTGARELIMPHGLAASFQILVQAPKKLVDIPTAPAL